MNNNKIIKSKYKLFDSKTKWSFNFKLSISYYIGIPGFCFLLISLSHYFYFFEILYFYWIDISTIVISTSSQLLLLGSEHVLFKFEQVCVL